MFKLIYYKLLSLKLKIKASKIQLIVKLKGCKNTKVYYLVIKIIFYFMHAIIHDVYGI